MVVLGYYPRSEVSRPALFRTQCRAGYLRADPRIAQRSNNCEAQPQRTPADGTRIRAPSPDQGARGAGRAPGRGDLRNRLPLSAAAAAHGRATALGLLSGAAGAGSG